MHGIGGLDVLRWLHQRPLLKTIRVVVLTGSDASAEIALARQLGANTFLVKPIVFANLDELAHTLDGH